MIVVHGTIRKPQDRSGRSRVGQQSSKGQGRVGIAGQGWAEPRRAGQPRRAEVCRGGPDGAVTEPGIAKMLLEGL